MMKNYDESVEINHNPDWPYNFDHPYRILIIGGSGLDKDNVLLNLTKHQRPGIDKILLYIKDPFESKYLLLINRNEKGRIKKLQTSKSFVEFSQIIENAYKNSEDYNPTKKRKV